MKLRIDGTDYPAVDYRAASTLHLMELQQQSKRLVEGGLGMSRLERVMRSTGEYSRARKAWVAEGSDPATEPEIPDDSTLAIAVMIYLARRRAGDEITFEQANDYRSLEYVVEAGDEDATPEGEGEPDPTRPGPASPVTPDGDPMPVEAP